MKRERRGSTQGDGSSSRRAERVASEVQRVVGNALVHEVRDPRAAMANITRVKVSPDLRQATVYFALLSTGEGEASEATEALNRAVPYLRRRLAEEVNMRYTPNLEFFYDEQLAGARRIDSLLRSLRDETET